MPLLYYVQNTAIGILLVLIMLYYVLGQGGKRQPQDSLFVYLLIAVMGILSLELCIDLFTGRSFALARPILTLSAFLFYLLNPLPGVFYFLYIDQVHLQWEKIPKKKGFLILIPMAINGIFVVMSLFNGMVFSIDATNTYRRGEQFFLVTICGLIYVFGSYVHMYMYSRPFKGERRKQFPLVLFFPFPVVVASLLQVHLEGVEIIGVSMALTLLLIFLHTQNTHASRDYLTGLYNRSLGEHYLQHLFQHKSEGRLIGGMMMDINDFKAINDIYGHDTGDTALRLFAKVVRDTFSRDWLICRYGGDEFLLFGELDDPTCLEEVLLNLTMALGVFNASELLPVPLTASVGHAVVQDTRSTTPLAFITLLDGLMYEHKREYRALHSPALQEGQPDR
ncbi:MAG: diguanylate cyclase [Sphaerochaeta sp.]|nr:diguanylate cyclase [Sphaerochaeta sp.]